MEWFPCFFVDFLANWAGPQIFYKTNSLILRELLQIGHPKRKNSSSNQSIFRGQGGGNQILSNKIHCELKTRTEGSCPFPIMIWTPHRQHIPHPQKTNFFTSPFQKPTPQVTKQKNKVYHWNTQKKTLFLSHLINLNRSPPKKHDSNGILWVWPLFQVTVTTRIITFLVGNPHKPLFATVTGKGPHPRYTLRVLFFSTGVCPWTLVLKRSVPRWPWDFPIPGISTLGEAMRGILFGGERCEKWKSQRIQHFQMPEENQPDFLFDYLMANDGQIIR